MSDAPKPLTSAELADWARFATSPGFFQMGSEFAARIIATIERRDSKIEKLREAANEVVEDRLLADAIEHPMTSTISPTSTIAKLMRLRDALAATEPK